MSGADGAVACAGYPVLAAPWRRLAASITDALLLLLLNLCIVGLWLLRSPFSVSPPPGLATGALVLGWAYLWIGWGVFGKTLGKRLWGIRVVPASGGRMTLARSALRCIGYCLACLPARVGLAAIVWDANRQGWHDRIAGTVVVMDTGPATTPPLPRCTCVPPPLPAPDLLGPLRRGALPALLYVALALLMTFPLVLHMNTRRAGTEGDGNVFVWNLWLFDSALRSGKPLASTDLAYYPQTVSLAYHTMNWLACAAAVPLLRALSLTATYNVLLLLTLASAAFAMYWLAAAVTGCRWSSVAAGFAFGFSSYEMAHAMGHLNLISIQFIPVASLLFYSALVTGRPTHAVAAGVALALCGLCDWYYLVFGTVATVCLAAAFLLARGRPSPALALRVTALGLLSGGTAALLLLPLLTRAQQERSKGSYMNVSLEVSTRFSADVLDFVRPSRLHSLRRPLPRHPHIERHLAPGLTVLGLGIVGFWRQRRLLTPWVAVALCGAVLACGPVLSVGGLQRPPALAGILLGGPPGSGLEPPLSDTSLLSYCLAVFANPGIALTQEGAGVTMPLYWLTRAVPLLAPIKAPGRLAVLLLMGACLCASAGLAGLYGTWAAQRGRKVAWTGVGVLCALILLEDLAVPYPTMSTRVHPFYHLLADDPTAFAIVEAPFHPCLSQYQAYQAVHHKALFQANLARTPTGALDFIEGNRLLHCLLGGPGSGTGDRLALPALLPGGEPLAGPEGRAALAEAAHQLCRVNARFIVVHKALLEPESFRLCRALLADRLRLPIAVDDDDITVFVLEEGPGAAERSRPAASSPTTGRSGH